MPFTPFHIGPALLIFGVLTVLDPIALVYGSILVDLEPLLVYLFALNHPSHGPAHSIIGIMLLLPLFYVATVVTRRVFPEADHMFTSKSKKYSAWLSIASGAVGGYSHLLLDAFLYPELNLAWPLGRWNPLLNQLSALTVYALCALTFVVGLPLVQLQRRWRLI